MRVHDIRRITSYVIAVVCSVFLAMVYVTLST